MSPELSCMVAASAMTAAAAQLVVIRRRQVGRPTPWRGLAAAAALWVDLWLWQVALDSTFGPERWLIWPLLAANLVLAFGGIHRGTGLRMHDDGLTLGGGQQRHRPN